MLQRTEQARKLSYDTGEELHRTQGAAPRRMDLVDIYAFLKSNWRIIAGWIIAAVTVALVYAFTATPLLHRNRGPGPRLAKNPGIQK
jgi:hypothetical protein